MNRFISTIVATLLFVGVGFVPTHADSPLLNNGSDLGDKTRFLQTDYSPALARLKADISRLSLQIQRLDTQRQNAQSPNEIAHLDQETARLGRLLAQDNITWIALETLQQYQEEIRAGKPFPGTQVVPL